MVAGRHIVLTGGGSTGHVAVNLALIPRLQEAGWTIDYIGSKEGIERKLIADFPQVTYHAISTGKLRRYLSKENVADVFRVMAGINQSRRLLKKLKPDVIFSKGGFVSVPVVYGGAMNHIPSITHESDLTPGLANKLCYRFVKKIMLTFEESMKYVPEGKGFYLGPVIREQIKDGSAERGRARYGFDGKKPVLVVLGGSLGAGAVNECIWENLDALLERFDILHGAGAGKGKNISRPGYVQVDYIKEGMNDALAMADLIVSRAGSNAIYEFLYYRKPMLLIPLPTTQSRGDQILNANRFHERGFADVLLEESMSPETFLQAVDGVMAKRDEMIAAQKTFRFNDAVGILVAELTKLADAKKLR